MFSQFSFSLNRLLLLHWSTGRRYTSTVNMCSLRSLIVVQLQCKKNNNKQTQIQPLLFECLDIRRSLFCVSWSLCRSISTIGCVWPPSHPRVTLNRTLRLAIRSYLREIRSVSQRVRQPCGCSGLPGPPSRPRRAPGQTGTCGRLRCHRRGHGLVRRRSRVRPFHRGANPPSCFDSSQFP